MDDEDHEDHEEDEDDEDDDDDDVPTTTTTYPTMACRFAVYRSTGPGAPFVPRVSTAPLRRRLRGRLPHGVRVLAESVCRCLIPHQEPV